MTVNDAPNTAGPDTIVLVHGFWVTPLSWEKWMAKASHPCKGKARTRWGEG
jgi:hypothetical protein